MAPVVRELRKHPAAILPLVCITAQHRDMLDQVLELFDITPDYDLDVMRENQSPTQVIRDVLERLEPVLLYERPDWVLVQGDTTTVMATALLAFHHRISIGHVEAGLRTWDKYQPFPEEINRKVADAVTDLYFAPTEWARGNLLREGVDGAKIVVTGNTVIDALLDVAGREYDWRASGGPLAGLPGDRRLILVTAHRRENFGAPLEAICAALRELAERYAGDVHFVYPVHPNPNVREPVHRLLGATPNISLLEPLEYLPLAQLLKRCTLALTDSGGVQEEAPSLGVPVLVMRNTTERPEAIQAGTARLAGPDRAVIVREASRLLDDTAAHAQMARAINPYGDGHAAKRTVEALLRGSGTPDE